LKAKILVIDDEKDILELISFNLSKEGYRITCVKTAEEGIELIKIEKFELIILDLMLPGMDGFDFCKTAKSEYKLMTPIIMLTAKSEEIDKITGLELGADHYITKPFSIRELLAVVKSILRRNITNHQKTQEIIERGILYIHTGKHEITIRKKPVNLTNLEFNILLELARKPGWVLSRYQLVENTRGHGIFVTDRSIDVHIVSLRKKLGKDSSMIETIRSVGYKFNIIE
jgi:two-component system phosphate regulon response regulator PhoB